MHEYVIIAMTLACGVLGKDFTPWCPNLLTDFTTCRDAFVASSSQSSLFTDPDVLLSINGMTSGVLATVCQEPTLTFTETLLRCMNLATLSSCVPSEWRDLFPTLDRMVEGLHYLCDNKASVDMACASEASRATNLQLCIQTSMQTSDPHNVSTVEGYKSYTCDYYYYAEPCYLTNYLACADKTAEIGKTVLSYEKPAVCGGCDILKPSLAVIILLVVRMASFYF